MNALVRALITGANGFVGTWLARRLCGRGDLVRCLVRPRADVWGLRDVPVEKVEGDVTQPRSLERAFEGVEVVFHLAGLRRAPSRAPFFDVNADGTDHVCRAAAAAGAKRLVLASSLAVHGPSTPERPHVEEDPFAPQEWYGESKAEAERVAQGYAGALEISVCRPPRIMGPGDRENLPFFKIAGRGIILGLGGAPRRISMVDVEDVVDLLLLQAERKEAAGEAFLAAGPEDVTLEELQEKLARALGVRARRAKVPEWALRSAAAAADAFSQMTGRPLALNRKLAAQLLATGWCASADKAHRLLGWRPARSLDESVQRTAAWYREHRWI